MSSRRQPVPIVGSALDRTLSPSSPISLGCAPLRVCKRFPRDSADSLVVPAVRASVLPREPSHHTALVPTTDLFKDLPPACAPAGSHRPRDTVFFHSDAPPRASRSLRMNRSMSPGPEEGAGDRQSPDFQEGPGSASRSRSRNEAGAPAGAEAGPDPGWGRGLALRGEGRLGGPWRRDSGTASSRTNGPAAPGGCRAPRVTEPGFRASRCP